MDSYNVAVTGEQLFYIVQDPISNLTPPLRLSCSIALLVWIARIWNTSAHQSTKEISCIIYSHMHRTLVWCASKRRHARLRNYNKIRQYNRDFWGLWDEEKIAEITHAARSILISTPLYKGLSSLIKSYLSIQREVSQSRAGQVVNIPKLSKKSAWSQEIFLCLLSHRRAALL